MKKEILSIDDIRLLVDSFYARVQKDELLGPVFNQRIGERWPEHLEKMYRFWQTVLLEEHTYTGSPFLPHARLPVEQAHFDRWLFLFYKVLDESFEGEKALEARWRAEKMADLFSHKIGYYRNHPDRRPL